MNSNSKIAVIIGAGPAGLTAAYELLHRTDIKPIIFEISDVVGGICRTVNYKGNRMDIGGHRFFSKSERVLEWWENILPLQGAPSSDQLHMEIAYENKKKAIHLRPDGPDPEKEDKVMLLRKRHSRIFFLRKFFDYPLSLGFKALSNLGLFRTIKIGVSYLTAHFFPIKPEASLRDFIINRFGKELYLTFFRSYTEKVWGVPCHQIKAAWGHQRIRGLNLRKALMAQLKGLFAKDPTYIQKHVETSLIERFMYPKYGPGQMWEEVARVIREKGGEIHLNYRADQIESHGNRVKKATVKNNLTGELRTEKCDYFFSTMPVKELIECMGESVPEGVKAVGRGLLYRDFFTVGLLLKKMKIDGKKHDQNSLIMPPDNWIYVQERDVKVGRIQIFNNWSPYLVKDLSKVWIGMEYFCDQGDELWNKSDKELMELAMGELTKMGLCELGDFLDGTVTRMLKTYPAYFGTYDRFHVIRNYVDQFENLFLIGRNGMHRYNNQDHSMLAAMTAVDNIIAGIKTKDNLWDVNTDQEYQEEK